VKHICPNTSKGSYAWKSILQGREVLKKGARWCVGNGDDISIWGDAWLPSLDNPRIAIPLGINFPEIRVRSLIKPSTRSWDLKLLQALFNTKEVKMIKCIPLGNAMAEDKLIWPHVQSGVYLVKSGYYFLSKERTMINFEASNLELF